MRKLFSLAAAAVATIVAYAAPASATVLYEFKAFDLINDDPRFGSISGAFTYSAPTFITSDTTVPVGSLSSCTFNSTAGPATCTDQLINFDIPPNDVIEFSGSVQGNDINVFYYFDGTALGTPGVHDSVVFGADQAAELTVSVVGGGSGAPEPAIWIVMLIGFGGLGVVMRLHQRALATSVA